MTIQFFIFTISISKRERPMHNGSRLRKEVEDELFDRKMMYLSRF
ncbi:hypothetical protein [Thalassobacillus hwangdonensis]